MKKLILPVLVALCCLATYNKAEAQVDVTLNPIGILFGDFNVGADFALSNNFSIEAQVGFGTGKLGEADWRNIPVNVVGKYYLNPKRGADRFYVDAFLRFVSRNFAYADNSGFANYKSTRLGIGFGLGYKIVATKGFVFDIGLGFGRALATTNKYEDSSGNQVEANWGNGIFLGKLGVGYRFGGGKD